MTSMTCEQRPSLGSSRSDQGRSYAMNSSFVWFYCSRILFAAAADGSRNPLGLATELIFTPAKIADQCSWCSCCLTSQTLPFLIIISFRI